MNEPSLHTRKEFLAAAMRWMLAGATGAVALLLWRRGNLVLDCPATCPACPRFADCVHPDKSDWSRP